MSKPYYYELNRLRGFAILLVVVGHSITRFPMNIMDMPPYNTIYDYIYSFHMPLFFMISGLYYGFSPVINYKDFIKEKAIRLLVPYCAFSLVVLVSKLLLSSLVNRNVGGISEGLYSIVLKGGFYWFLYALFIIFLIFPFLERIVKRTNVYIVGIGIIVLYFTGLYPRIFCLQNAGYGLVYFYVGYALAPHYEKIREGALRFYLLILLVILIPFVLFGKNGITQNKIEALLVPFLGIILSFLIIIPVKTRVFNHFMDRFGNYSLQIYLIESLVLVITRHILINYLRITEPAALVLLIVLAKISISTTMAHTILKKFALTRLICGLPRQSELEVSGVKSARKSPAQFEGSLTGPLLKAIVGHNRGHNRARVP